MTEEGSRVELVGSFFKIFDKNEALLIKVKRSKNRLYMILLKDHQNLPKISIDVESYI